MRCDIPPTDMHGELLYYGEVAQLVAYNFGLYLYKTVDARYYCGVDDYGNAFKLHTCSLHSMQ